MPRTELLEVLKPDLTSSHGWYEYKEDVKGVTKLYSTKAILVLSLVPLDVCGGSLISPRLVLSAYHCTWSRKAPPHDGSTPCDHSDEKRLAILGHHAIIPNKKLDKDLYYTIPFIDVLYPNHGDQIFKRGDYHSHDLAILVLKFPARLSRNVQPICLPEQDQDFSGMTAEAAGWGRFAAPNVSTKNSHKLRTVRLTVSNKKYKHYNFFGTKLKKNKKGEYQDPCSGDSGTMK